MSCSPGADEASEASEGMKIDTDDDDEEEGIDYSLKFKEQQSSSSSSKHAETAGSSLDRGAAAGSSLDGGAAAGSSLGGGEAAGSSLGEDEAGIKEDDSEDVKPSNGTDETGCYFLRQKCQICGSPAANHLHYGAFCCYSCRAFFRRSGERTYKCSSGNNNCKVENNTRKACKKCRYRLCLEAGMKPSLVDRHVKKKKGNDEDTTSRNLQPLKLKLKTKLVHKMRANQAIDQKSDGSPTAVSPLNPQQVSTSYSTSASNDKTQVLHSTEIKLEEDTDMKTSKYGSEQYKDTPRTSTSRDASLQDTPRTSTNRDASLQDIGVDIKQEDTMEEQPIEVSKIESPPSIWSKPNLWNRVLSTSPDPHKALQNYLSPKTSPSPTHQDIKPKGYPRPSPTTSPFQTPGFPSSPQSSSFEINAPMHYSSRQSPQLSPSHSRAHKRQGSSQSPQPSSSHYVATMHQLSPRSPQISATIRHIFPNSPHISPPHHQATTHQGFSRSPQISPQYPPSPTGQSYRQSPHVSSAHSPASMRPDYRKSPQLSPSELQSSMRQGFLPQTSPSQAYAQMLQGLRLPNYNSPTLNEGLLQYGFQLSPENSSMLSKAKIQPNLHQSPRSSTSYPILNDGQSQHGALSPQGYNSGSPPSPNRSFDQCFRPPLRQLSPTMGMPLLPRFLSNMIGAPSAIPSGYPRLPNPNNFSGHPGLQSRSLPSSYSPPFHSPPHQYSSETRVSPTGSRGVEVIKKARISVICGPRRSSDKTISNQTLKEAEVEETRIHTITQNDCTLLKKIMAQQEKDDVIEKIETNNNLDLVENPMDLLKSLAARDLLQIPDSPIMKLTLEEQKQCRYLIWTWESAHIGVDKIRTERVEIERDMEPDYVKNNEATDIRQSIKEYFDGQDSNNSFNTFFSNHNNQSVMNNRLQCNILLGVSCRLYGGDEYVFCPDIPDVKERFYRKYSYLLRSPWASSMQQEVEIRNIMMETANLLANDRVIEVLFTNCVISGFTTGYEQQEVNLASLGIEDDVYPRNQTLLLFRYLKYKEGEEKSKITFRTLKNLVPKLERAVTIFFENRLMI